MHIVEKPYLEVVPQFGQVVLDGWRASFLIACSGDVGIYSIMFCLCFFLSKYRILSLFIKFVITRSVIVSFRKSISQFAIVWAGSICTGIDVQTY